MSTISKGIGKGNSPISLQNLMPVYSSEKAREMQKASVKSRLANTEKRKAMAATASEWKKMGTEVLSDLPSAIDILKMRMLQHLNDNQYDEAAELAKTLAEYEQPKLQRVDGMQGTFDASNLSDEELEQKLKALKE